MSLDAGEAKGGDRENRKHTAVLGMLKCWGVKGEQGYAHGAIYHPMRNAQSADTAIPLLEYCGNDHRANQDKAFAPWVQMSKPLREKFQPDYGYLPLPPELLSKSWKVEKSLWKTKFWERMATVKSPRYKLRMLVAADLSAQMEFAGCRFAANEKSSPFNETVHCDQVRG